MKHRPPALETNALLLDQSAVSFIVTVLNCFSVWEVRFHKKSPSNLFSCSEDGSVRKLNSSFEMKSLTFGASKVEVLELLSQCGSSINSLDTSGDRMICASDAESVYIVDDIL